MFKIKMLIFFVIFKLIFEFFSKFVDIVLVNETAQESEYPHADYSTYRSDSLETST